MIGTTTSMPKTDRIENKSAIRPVNGVSRPPTPKARPVIRLEAMDVPRGANFCTRATPRGRVAMRKNPVKKAAGKTQLPLR